MNTKDPLRDWADIRLFLAIREAGSLVGAAERLELTQPTVGRRLAAMEQRFGTPLFVRAGRRMQLTDAGEAILESARRMEREMFAIERSLEAQSTALRGEVVVSATEGTGTDWLTPVLRDFHDEYPEIVVTVQIDNRAVDLVHREADIAIRLGQPAQDNVIAKKLLTVGFGLYASADYLANTPPVTSIEDLAVHKMVGLDAAGSNLRSPIAFPSANPLPGDYVYLTNSPAAQLSAVRCGFGIGLISHRWATMQGDLVRLLPDFTPHTLDLWLVTHEDLRYSARIRAIYDFLAERIVRDLSLFQDGVPGEH